MEHRYIEWKPTEEDTIKILDLLNELVKQAIKLKVSRQALSSIITVYNAVAAEGITQKQCRSLLQGFFAAMFFSGVDAAGKMFDNETMDYIAKVTFGVDPTD